MKIVVCAVLDLAAQVYGRPNFYSALGAATRAFVDEVNDSRKDNVLFHHPEDFQLFHVGYFDDVSGLFDSQPPKLLLHGAAAKQT